MAHGLLSWVSAARGRGLELRVIGRPALDIREKNGFPRISQFAHVILKTDALSADEVRRVGSVDLDELGQDVRSHGRTTQGRGMALLGPFDTLGADHREAR